MPPPPPPPPLVEPPPATSDDTPEDPEGTPKPVPEGRPTVPPTEPAAVAEVVQRPAEAPTDAVQLAPPPSGADAVHAGGTEQAVHAGVTEQASGGSNTVSWRWVPSREPMGISVGRGGRGAVSCRHGLGFLMHRSLLHCSIVGFLVLMLNSRPLLI